MGDRLRPARLALLALAIGCALAIDVLGIFPRVIEGPRNGDFSTFWVASRIDRSLVYDFDAISRAQEPIVGRLASPRPYLNPPIYLAVLKPLGQMPIGVALAVWAVLTLGLFLAVCLSVIAPSRLLLVAISPVVLSTAAAGQVALLVGSCVIGGVVLLEKRPLLAGALFAAAALIKPPAVVLVPLALIACRQWRALAASLAVGTAAGLASVIIQGPDIWLRWLGALSEFSRFLTTSTVIEKGASPATIVRWLAMPAPFGLIFQGLCGLLGVVTVWLVFRRREAPLPRLAALTAGCLLVTPYAMTQELMPMLPFAAAMLLDRKAGPLLWFASYLVIASLAAPLGVILMAAALLHGLTVRAASEGPAGVG